MTSAERYQKELEQILKDTEARASRATLLTNIETFEQILTAAAEVEIEEAEAWEIVESDPQGPKAGLLTLLAVIAKKQNLRKAP